MPAGQGAQHGGTWYRSADGKWDWKADTSSDELQDVPLDMISWTVINSTRKDVPWAAHKNRFGRDVSVEALPVSERPLK
jgi:hypothetical protein